MVLLHFQKIRLAAFWSLSSFALFLSTSCNNASQPSAVNPAHSVTTDSLINYNKMEVKSEDEEISDFIARHQWTMIKTPTGLRYMIYHKGHGEQAAVGKHATIGYSVRLLNGDLMYSSDQRGTREFEVGHGGVESGLEEGILFLHVGDRAKFIVPSHLAFGLLGDQDKIPQRATLVYEIELIKLK
jgi:FKBP-type peptidyl-prolyl cis-trans isomerase FkpA